MCGRVIQRSEPLAFAIVDGIDVRDSRLHNHPPRWDAAPSQELLVIRRNHKSGEVSLDPLRWGLIPNWCNDPQGGRKPINAECETVHTLPTFRDAYRSRRCILPVDVCIPQIRDRLDRPVCGSDDLISVAIWVARAGTRPSTHSVASRHSYLYRKPHPNRGWARIA